MVKLRKTERRGAARIAARHMGGTLMPRSIPHGKVAFKCVEVLGLRDGDLGPRGPELWDEGVVGGHKKGSLEGIGDGAAIF